MARIVLLCLGWGFSARHVAAGGSIRRWAIRATTRRPAPRTRVRFYPFTRGHRPDYRVWHGVTHLLVSIPPTRWGDPGLDHARYGLGHCPSLRWIGYLSSTGVYGDHGGARVDERTPAIPILARAVRRRRSEKRWIAASAPHRRLALHIFRLAGIYGPGRSPLDGARRGTARRIRAPGHVFSRIHVEDIAAVVERSIQRCERGQTYRRRIYNVCDDHPAPGHEVITFAAGLLGMAPPPWSTPARLPPMARSFYRDRRRIDNRRAKRELGWHPGYPDYRSGLRAVARGEASPKR